jgi:hypothetical protein
MLIHTKIIMTVPATPVDENGFCHPTNEFSCQKPGAAKPGDG